MAETQHDSKIAVVIPCYNEAHTIGRVIDDFCSSLPNALIYVFDNNSSDESAAIATQHGAVIKRVKTQGKGAVVRAICRDIDADYYIMVDGDDTYPAAQAASMLSLAMENNADMIVGNRLRSYQQSNSRAGHLFGNQLFTRVVNYLFSSDLEDILSGYRVMSRRFVKSLPLFSAGFEVETAISIHAIEVDARLLEVPIEYNSRPIGSESKLNTLRDGTKILREILVVYKDQKPKVVFGLCALLFFSAGLIVGIPVVAEYLATGLVPRFPSAILATGLCLISFLCSFTGVILSGIAKSRREFKKLAFLSIN